MTFKAQKISQGPQASHRKIVQISQVMQRRVPASADSVEHRGGFLNGSSSILDVLAGRRTQVHSKQTER